MDPGSRTTYYRVPSAVIEDGAIVMSSPDDGYGLQRVVFSEITDASFQLVERILDGRRQNVANRDAHERETVRALVPALGYTSVHDNRTRRCNRQLASPS